MDPCRKVGLPVTFVLVLPDCLMLIRASWCCLHLWFLLPGPTSPHSLPCLSLKTWLGGLNFLTSYLLTSLSHTSCLTLSPHTYIPSLDPQCLRVGPCALSEEDPIPSTVFRMKREGQVKRFTDTGPNTWLTQPWCQSTLVSSHPHPPLDASFFPLGPMIPTPLTLHPSQLPPEHCPKH